MNTRIEIHQKKSNFIFICTFVTFGENDTPVTIIIVGSGYQEALHTTTEFFQFPLLERVVEPMEYFVLAIRFLLFQFPRNKVVLLLKISSILMHRQSCCHNLLLFIRSATLLPLIRSATLLPQVTALLAPFLLFEGPHVHQGFSSGF